MPNFDVVTRDHVISTLEEYDDRGADDFLTDYGFGGAHEYLLLHNGRSYDSNAVLGVAHKYATGAVASDSAFTSGEGSAAEILRTLGFDVTYIDVPAPTDVPATGEWREASEVGPDAAQAAWAEAARDVLLEAAGRYQAVVTQKDLSNQVQYRTGIRTKQPMRHWIGDVLGRVAADSSQRDEPLLSSLCINTDGSVGDSYAIAVLATTGESPEDADSHAAHERLACYRHFEADDLPPGGGFAALVPKLAAARDRVRKANLADRPITKCPTCNLQIPASRICDFCD